MKNEIILYQPNELTEHIEVRMDEEKETFCQHKSKLRNFLSVTEQK
ncbi:MAG: hypothetical protein U0T72_10530 [Chitinophagales bacterium]